MKRTFAAILLLSLILTVSCARFSTVQTDVSPNRTITTRATAWTCFSANNKLATWRASQTDKTQGASVGGFEQSSSGSNVVGVINALTDLAKAIKLP